MRKREKQFLGYINRLKSPYRIDRIDLINFLMDLKDTGKCDSLLQISERDLYKMDRDELIIEFDNVRNKVHCQPKILFELFPNLKKKWLDKLSYGKYENIEVKK